MNGVPSGEKYLTKQILFRKNFDSLKFEGYSFSMTLQKSEPVINNNKSLSLNGRYFILKQQSKQWFCAYLWKYG